MKLKHPDGGIVDVRPDAVDIYLSQGWEKTTAVRASATGDNKSPATTEKGQG